MLNGFQSPQNHYNQQPQQQNVPVANQQNVSNTNNGNNNLNGSQILVFQNGQPVKMNLSHYQQPQQGLVPPQQQQPQLQNTGTTTNVEIENLMLELQASRELNCQLQSKIGLIETEMSKMLPPSYIA